MRKIICLAFLIGFCFVISCAQNCGEKLKTAREFKEKNKYKDAARFYESVLNGPCGDYDGNVAKELSECKMRLAEMNSVFLLEHSRLECEGKGGTLVLSLKKAPADWSVNQVPDWLQVSDMNKNEKKIVFNVSANPRAEIRKGTIQLKSDKGRIQDFNVTQKEGEERISIQSDHLSFGGGGGQQTVMVDANFNWGFGVTESWIRLDKQNGKLLVTCSANDYVKERNTTITIFGKNVNQNIEVVQFAGDTYFSVSGIEEYTVSFNAAGGKNNKLRVNCNDDWRVENQCPWIKTTSSGSAIMVQCETNPWAESRTASFEVVTAFEGQRKTILVEQSGAKPKIDRISLPSSREGERTVRSVRPHYRSLTLKGDKGDMLVKVYSNVQNWTYQIHPKDVDWIVSESSPKDSLLKLTFSDNNDWDSRDVTVIFDAKGQRDTLFITQNKRGYHGILVDYFDGRERTWKTTRFFMDLYGLQSVGFRIGGLAKRWKFVEFSLLDFDVEFAPYQKYADWHMLVDWEPIIRGYLPVSRNDRRWALFMGMGLSVNIFNMSLPAAQVVSFEDTHFLFEIGAEYHWRKRNNVSSRIFYRCEAGNVSWSSFGISFDFYKWTKKWK